MADSSKTRSNTTRRPGHSPIIGSLCHCNGPTYRTVISRGKNRVAGYGATTEKSRAYAAKKWKRK